jgi:hypothetical protein
MGILCQLIAHHCYLETENKTENVKMVLMEMMTVKDWDYMQA